MLPAGTPTHGKVHRPPTKNANRLLQRGILSCLEPCPERQPAFLVFLPPRLPEPRVGTQRNHDLSPGQTGLSFESLCKKPGVLHSRRGGRLQTKLKALLNSLPS
jgi:hypothetical protein